MYSAECLCMYYEISAGTEGSEIGLSIFSLAGSPGSVVGTARNTYFNKR